MIFQRWKHEMAQDKLSLLKQAKLSLVCVINWFCLLGEFSRLVSLFLIFNKALVKCVNFPVFLKSLRKRNLKCIKPQGPRKLKRRPQQIKDDRIWEAGADGWVVTESIWEIWARCLWCRGRYRQGTEEEEVKGNKPHHSWETEGLELCRERDYVSPDSVKTGGVIENFLKTLWDPKSHISPVQLATSTLPAAKDGCALLGEADPKPWTQGLSGHSWGEGCDHWELPNM